MSILSVIFAILLFSFLIFVHELGHFVTAKAFNVQVNEFSLFMGPAIWKKQKGETLYALRCIPIGGFCAMEGEDGDSDNPRAFTNAAWWKRVIILVAGAAVNFLVGIALFACVYAPRENLIVPVIDYVEEGSAIGAFENEVGFRAGDRVLKLDGETIYTYADFSMVLALNSNEKTNPQNLHDIVLLRDGKQVELRDFPMEKREFANEDGTTELRFGITFGSVKNTLLTLLDYAWDNAMSNVQMVRISLQMLFTGQVGMQDMAGPVGIVKLMSDTAEMSGTHPRDGHRS